MIDSRHHGRRFLVHSNGTVMACTDNVGVILPGQGRDGTVFVHKGYLGLLALLGDIPEKDVRV